MSDPMTNTDVEDVLASIRRLVSDNKRIDAKTEPKAPNDRLVLTPSLRVMDDTPTEDDAATDNAVQKDEDDALLAFAASVFETPAVAPEAISDDADAPTVKETQAAATDRAAGDEVDDELDALDTAYDVQEQKDDVLVLTDDPSQDDTTVQGAAEAADSTADLPDAAPGVTVAEDWADVPDSTDAPDGEDLAEDDLALDVGEAAKDDTADDDTPVADAAVVATAAPEKSLSEKIAALEMLVGKRRDNFEPDDPGAGAYAGTQAPAMEWEDAETDEDVLEARVEDTPPFDSIHDDVEEDAPAYAAYVEAEADDRAGDATIAQVFSSDEDVLDEEALRELVSDIVREELQGALGERITRNVRKLVRREIHRALAAQDLE